MRKKVPQLVHSAAHWRIIWYMLQIEGLVKWKKTPAKGIFLNLSQKPRNWFKDRNHMIMEINVCFVFNWELCSEKLDSSKLENWLTQSKMCKCETEDNSGIYIYMCMGWRRSGKWKKAPAKEFYILPQKPQKLV